ncbi:MATE family efflux transporter [Prosthecomicrobium hirschii]|uniref:MATE family efflux transporter n=1 Tax=Prosthecodimorpha hirschii TaxID=665126 RepID=UPI0009F94B8B|nr:MATE family efflux transporter [Prosthecomicrobium hirschii]
MSEPRENSGAEAQTPGRPKAVFTTGSTLRHVVVMTTTGSIGLIAVFLVDFLNLFYIAQLGREDLTAAIGYAGALLFFMISINVGVMIAATALCARAIGAGRPEEARRITTSSLTLSALVLVILSAAIMPLLGPLCGLMGATGATRDIAVDFLIIVTPSTPIMGLGMVASGLLRARGDARRAMYVTLAGAVASAVLDPILIFGLGLGVTGAAIATVAARFAMVTVGLYGIVIVHDMAERPNLDGIRSDWRPLAAIAVPAILTNVATPAANAWVTAEIAPFGDSALAAWAVLGRIIPLAYGGLFALAGAVGPIVAQNYGAGLFPRMRRTLTDCHLFTLVYCLVVWLALFIGAEPVIRAFALSGEGAVQVRAFATWIAPSYVFLGALFVANAAFNNLGFATLSTAFNWGRATLGTIPFTTAGAWLAGSVGVLAGQALGTVLFGTAAAVVAYRVVDRLEATAWKPEREGTGIA